MCKMSVEEEPRQETLTHLFVPSSLCCGTHHQVDSRTRTGLTVLHFAA
jgi:hypothetical protein